MKEPFESDRREMQMLTGRKYLSEATKRVLINKWVKAGHTLGEIERETRWRGAIVTRHQTP